MFFPFKLAKRLLKVRFMRYFTIGVVATATDWSVFYLLSALVSINYLISLAIAYSLGGVVNFFGNKFYTFDCKSKKIVRQMSVFWIFLWMFLGVSFVLMYLFVDVFMLHKMLSRIATTFIVFVLLYITQRSVVFNKKHFV